MRKKFFSFVVSSILITSFISTHNAYSEEVNINYQDNYDEFVFYTELQNKYVEDNNTNYNKEIATKELYILQKAAREISDYLSSNLMGEAYIYEDEGVEKIQINYFEVFEDEVKAYVKAKGIDEKVITYDIIILDEENNNHTVIVTVLQIYGNTILLKSNEDSFVCRLGERLLLTAANLDSNIEPFAGMKLKVTYNGGILESYPAQFGNVMEVSIDSDDPDIFKGDANCDGQIDMADSVMIMQALANPNRYSENGTALNHITSLGIINGDTDGNGLTVGDAQSIQTILLGN